LHQPTFTNQLVTNQLLRTPAFTQTNFSTNQLLHKPPFAFCPNQRLQTSFYTTQRLHTPAFAQTSFYTNHLLRKPPFVPTNFYKQAFAQFSF
jgi:hypothetical protein